MITSLEKSIRIQQVKLLRFERFLLQIAPVVIATGISAHLAMESREHLNGLSDAKSVLSQLEGNTALSSVIEGAENEISRQIGLIEAATEVEDRLEAFKSMLRTVDDAHSVAQEAASKGGIRLIGERVHDALRLQGGTPKEPTLAVLLRAFARA